MWRVNGGQQSADEDLLNSLSNSSCYHILKAEKSKSSSSNLIPSPKIPPSTGFTVQNSESSYRFQLGKTEIPIHSSEPKRGESRMTKPSLCFLFLLLLFVLCSDASLVADTYPSSAHKELTSKGFPVGLLPDCVSSYSLNRTSGDFFVDLGDSCQIKLPPDNYLATYEKRITGKLLEGKIAKLNGIRVWAFFKWWYITGIRTSGDNLVFEVGVVTAKYPVKNFDESPQCNGRRSSS
ncbi:hypothetical protein H6P81_003846 [Aristolochia fimbriata]|uniref:Uncharacterized protein n=1 Tax=Aristolochia fimbriata TaxID=158543 RepID=A0AAV7FDX9_ARIFI|nr:hypothetical protein H6P81_003846 [Aristolochia fimbriata]